ncbi:MAG: glycoside hydrolase family 97 protein [Muribaculaceae bacterium]|nr:glycoside hydrolase family 97 protein [Muribaculaceae bacterium]
MKTNIILPAFIFAAMATSFQAGASTYELQSPDGKTVVTVSDADGAPVYTVDYDGKSFLLPSPLGLVTNIGDLSRGLAISATAPVENVTDSYTLGNIKASHVDYTANRGVITFAKDGKPVFDLIMQVSDNNLAFRYRLLPQGETLCCVVESEATGFTMPEGTTTFLCPQSAPMGGFARTAPSYETNYTLDDTTGKNGWGNGYSFPCLFHNGDKGWALVSETGIAGDYCGAHLTGKDGGLYEIAYAQPGEQNGFGSTGAAIALPGYTPWRTVTVGESLAPVVETTIPFDVVTPLYEPSRDYEYGKGAWSWIIKMDPSCNFDEQKRYIDFAADMGWSTVLVDALWDTQIGYEGIEELARYGKSRGVDLYLWYNSNGSWNDAPQGPRGIMNDIVKRRQAMKWMQKNGIRGIKVDFFGGDKQDMMRLYHDILADANDYGILVIFHGCTLPRGWDRMYPNYAASEAVLASENLHFSQGMCDAEAVNACIHPFIRNTVGSMDFGGSTLNKYYSSDNSPRGSKRMTSDVFALATAVLFQSPVQHFAMAPNNLTDAPSWAVDFMKNVPTTWDEVRFIDGYPGRYVIMARRSGDRWYLAGINAQAEPLVTTLQLPAEMAASSLGMYSDDKTLNGSYKEIKADKKGKVKINIPCNGGVVIVTQ